jgi:hypothetical protein
VASAVVAAAHRPSACSRQGDGPASIPLRPPPISSL